MGQDPARSRELSRRRALTLGALSGLAAATAASGPAATAAAPTGPRTGPGTGGPGPFTRPRGLDGRALLPGDRGYALETAPFNLTQQPTPGLVIAAETPADVRAAVRLATERHAPVAVLATGHQPSVPIGRDAVLVSTRSMRGVTIDARRHRARAEAGALWQDVLDKCVPAGLAPIVGSTPIVGVVGYTLGGGLSPTLGRTYGYAADHVRSVDLVGADGRLRTVTADSDPELFFGLRGGKSNFGLVTAIEFDLFPVTSFYGGAIYFDGKDAARLFHAYRRWTTTVPDAMSSSVALIRMPPAAPPPLRNKLVAALRICYLGSEKAGKSLVEPLRAAATPLIDGVKTQPFEAFPSIHADPVDPVAAYERTGLLRELTADAVDTLIALTGPAAPVPISLVEVRHLGGALGRAPEQPDAVSNRDAAYTLFMAGFGEADATRSAEAEVIRRMAPWSTGGMYLNFMAEDDASPDAVRHAYRPDVYQRLRRLKRRVDPTNTFRLNHNIPPA
ncbi:FAD-binding oxidoreductase [Cryptosporangium phraense]|uniref:FAD-dependent oxidoreductase n=1 Tax=Cryptosporangium phraense TaxID=2593070 RepID=A0A545AGB7_9ACTN|nr:FAD-binding protein [Cryptosporangium phraense]TQS40369.1 FAD-dependent oxidoreductase [Cryptosporangium phraense]